MMSGPVLSTPFIPSLLICAMALVGCQSSAATGVPANNSIADVSPSPLQDIGPAGGFLFAAIVDKSAHPPEEMPSVAEFPIPAGRTETQLTLRQQITRSISGRRLNPQVEFGAIYYFPARNNVESDGKIIQKLCATVDGHKLDDVVTTDKPTIYLKERRRLELSGKTDVALLDLFGISAKAGAKYIFDVEVSNVRRRGINIADAEEMRSRLLAGKKCRTELLPQAEGRKKFQLISGLYGEVIVKQVFEVNGGASAGYFRGEIALGKETESGRFMFFKLYDYAVN